jgi:hypothetical protein
LEYFFQCLYKYKASQNGPGGPGTGPGAGNGAAGNTARLGGNARRAAAAEAQANRLGVTSGIVGGATTSRLGGAGAGWTNATMAPPSQTGGGANGANGGTGGGSCLLTPGGVNQFETTTFVIAERDEPLSVMAPGEEESMVQQDNDDYDFDLQGVCQELSSITITQPTHNSTTDSSSTVIVVTSPQPPRPPPPPRPQNIPTVVVVQQPDDSYVTSVASLVECKESKRDKGAASKGASRKYVAIRNRDVEADEGYLEDAEDEEDEDDEQGDEGMFQLREGRF